MGNIIISASIKINDLQDPETILKQVRDKV
jgi:hypothetical protein